VSERRVGGVFRDAVADVLSDALKPVVRRLTVLLLRKIAESCSWLADVLEVTDDIEWVDVEEEEDMRE
jgi:hypothetical protein